MTTAPVVPTGPSPDAPGAPGTVKTAGLAIASLVAGILGLCTAGLGGIAGLILGVIALKKIGRSGGALRGCGLAIAGLIVSVCTVLVWMLAAVVVGVLLLGPSSKEVEKDRSPVKRAAAPAVAQPALAAPTAAAPADLALADAPDFWEDFFDDSNGFTGPPLTEEMIAEAEAALGYRLPQSYLRLIRVKNGGSPKRQAYPTGKTGWADDHVRVVEILGIGGTWGIVGSRHWSREWGYPDVGVVVGETPSAGHDTIMLDYSECGPEGEPRVIHVETETRDAPEVQVLAPDFETFLRGLVDHRPFDEEIDRALEGLKKPSPGMR